MRKAKKGIVGAIILTLLLSVVSVSFGLGTSKAQAAENINAETSIFLFTKTSDTECAERKSEKQR